MTSYRYEGFAVNWNREGEEILVDVRKFPSFLGKTFWSNYPNRLLAE